MDTVAGIVALADECTKEGTLYCMLQVLVESGVDQRAMLVVLEYRRQSRRGRRARCRMLSSMADRLRKNHRCNRVGWAGVINLNTDRSAGRIRIHAQSLRRMHRCVEGGVEPGLAQQFVDISIDDGIDTRNTAGSEFDYGDRRGRLCSEQARRGSVQP